MDEYIRREDAIKCIEDQCIDGKMWGNDESEGTLIEAYSAIDDLMEIPPADVAPVRHERWIPVTERLPEEKVNCIVHYKHAYCDTDGYWAIGFCYYDGEKFNFDPAYKVTHWMPIPHPPKGE